MNEALRQEVLAVDGVTDVIENRQALHVRFENEESSSGGMCDLLSDRNRDQDVYKRQAYSGLRLLHNPY